jgi:hypothetical protein
MIIRVHNGKNVLCSNEMGGENSCLLLSFLLVLFLTTILHIPLFVSVSVAIPLGILFFVNKDTDVEGNLQKVEDDPMTCLVHIAINFEDTFEDTYFIIRFKHCGIVEPLEIRERSSHIADFLLFDQGMAAAERELTLTYCRTIPLLYYLTPVEPIKTVM